MDVEWRLRWRFGVISFVILTNWSERESYHLKSLPNFASFLRHSEWRWWITGYGTQFCADGGGVYVVERKTIKWWGKPALWCLFRPSVTETKIWYIIFDIWGVPKKTKFGPTSYTYVHLLFCGGWVVLSCFRFVAHCYKI